MTNGWTGGQYSVYRALFGAYLLVHFTMLLPWGTELFSDRGVLPAGASPLLTLFPNVLAINDGPVAVAVLLGIAAMSSILFMAGLYDRVAALVMWYILACLFGRNPLIANPSLPFVGWLLLAHVVLPPAPYGSWTAHKRVDPRGGWSMPPPIFAASWIVMSLAYSYSGFTKLISPSWIDGTALARVAANPLARPGFVSDLILAIPDPLVRVATWSALALELLFAPLALIRGVRPWIWLAMLGLHAGLLCLVDFADLSLGMMFIHLFTFDPQWIHRRFRARADQVFYDGACGLCHRATRFILSEDPAGTAFRFAPLQGDTFASALSAEQRAKLPDSVIVKTETGELLTRSAAAFYILHRLGGAWRIIAVLSAIVPSSLRDVAYDFVAGVRYQLFARPKEACPLLPRDLRARFDS